MPQAKAEELPKDAASLPRDTLFDQCTDSVRNIYGKDYLKDYEYPLKNVLELIFRQPCFSNLQLNEIGSETAFSHDNKVEGIDLTLTTGDYRFDIFIATHNQRYSKLYYHWNDELPPMEITRLMFNAAINEWDIAILSNPSDKVRKYYLYKKYLNWDNIEIRVVIAPLKINS